MNEEIQSPLVLLVEDDDEFREVVLPAAFDAMGARHLKARNVAEALRAAAGHERGSEDPLRLVVLDMHMPLGDDTTQVADDGGIQFLRGFRLINCPVIVFTAYPSYRNCLAAVEAGAAAYIPKSEDEEGKGGLDELLETSKRLLYERKPPGVPAPPTNEWLGRNYDWLCEHFHGKWVAFVDGAEAKEEGLSDIDKYPNSEGVLILSGSTYAEVRDLVIGDVAIFKQAPAILMVPPSDEDFDTEGEEE